MGSLKKTLVGLCLPLVMAASSGARAQDYEQMFRPKPKIYTSCTTREYDARARYGQTGRNAEFKFFYPENLNEEQSLDKMLDSIPAGSIVLLGEGNPSSKSDETAAYALERLSGREAVTLADIRLPEKAQEDARQLLNKEDPPTDEDLKRLSDQGPKIPNMDPDSDHFPLIDSKNRIIAAYNLHKTGRCADILALGVDMEGDIHHREVLNYQTAIAQRLSDYCAKNPGRTIVATVGRDHLTDSDLGSVLEQVLEQTCNDKKRVVRIVLHSQKMSDRFEEMGEEARLPGPKSGEARTYMEKSKDAWLPVGTYYLDGADKVHKVKP